MACSKEKGRQNYAQLIQIQDVAIERLGDVLKKYTKDQSMTIDKLLSNHKGTILKSDVGKRSISVLFPQGSTETDLDAWDTTLYCCILTNCCRLPSTLENDVNDIRLTRNAIHHSPKAIVDDADYTRFSGVFKTFVLNALDYINDETLKVNVKKQVEEAERLVSEQVVKAYERCHKLYLKDTTMAESLKENINAHSDDRFDKLESLFNKLSEEVKSQIKPPEETHFKLYFRNCTPHEEEKMSHELEAIFEEELAKEKKLHLSDNDYTRLQDVAKSFIKRLREEKVEPTKAGFGCVCIYISFENFESYMDILKNLRNGSLSEIALPLQNALRCCFGNDDLELEMVMTDEELSFCFEDTLDCLQNVYHSAMQTKEETHDDVPDCVEQGMECSDAPGTERSDIVMSTFYTELGKKSDLKLSKNDAHICGQIMKTAMEKISAGKGQGLASAAGTKGVITRLTKQSVKTKEEYISTIGKDRQEDLPFVAAEELVIRSKKQSDKTVDKALLQQCHSTEHSPEDSLPKGRRLLAAKFQQIIDNKGRNISVLFLPTMASNTQSQALLVAAFDFGTTYSGYAFSFRDDPNKIHTNQNWYAGGGASRLVSLKTPTSVLLNPKGEFDKFGFEAEDTYATLAEDGEHHGWRLFRRFKMVLHTNAHLTKDVTVEDFSGKQMTAFPLFVMSIKYLREHLLKAVTTQKIGVEETDILYVLTVPAIWDDNAKRFMRDAAIEAGVDPKRLKLALEPECASVWCETLGMDVKGAVAFQGSQYMVVDVGGGTADISVYERKPDGTLKEIHKASGGPWGGIYVDENYMKMLYELFGEKALTEFRMTEMNDYFDVTREFEHKKRSFDTDKTKQIIVRVSASLRDLAEKYSSKSLEERIASLKLQENAITTRGKDKLKIDTTVVQSWFKRPIDLLIQHLKSLLAEPKIKSVRTVILVGGFGESPYVQERIRNELAGVRLIVPSDAGLVVLKGAVRFGHNPAIVSSRIMKYTYGTGVYDTFDEHKHPEEKKVLLNGEWLVDNYFDVYVRVNEEVRVDQQVTMEGVPKGDICHTPVYRTTQENPEYTTDPGCQLLGTVELENTTDIPYEQQIIETSFMFGDTELLVKTKNKTTGKEAYMNFECFN